MSITYRPSTLPLMAMWRICDHCGVEACFGAVQPREDGSYDLHAVPPDEKAVAFRHLYINLPAGGLVDMDVCSQACGEATLPVLAGRTWYKVP